MKVVSLETRLPKNRKRPRLWYLTAATIVRFLALLFFRLKTRGVDLVPLEGACLIASNHASFLDPPLIGASLLRREMHFFARKSLFRVWWLGPIIRSLNSIPIDLGNADFAGVREALRLMKNGEALLVFPEGTRSYDGNFLEPLAGVGMLAARSGASVLPVRVFGAEKAWPRKKKFFRPVPVSLVVGKPFRFELTPEESKSRETYQAISEEIMRRIGELAP